LLQTFEKEILRLNELETTHQQETASLKLQLSNQPKLQDEILQQAKHIEQLKDTLIEKSKTITQLESKLLIVSAENTQLSEQSKKLLSQQQDPFVITKLENDVKALTEKHSKDLHLLDSERTRALELHAKIKLELESSEAEKRKLHSRMLRDRDAFLTRGMEMKNKIQSLETSLQDSQRQLSHLQGTIQTQNLEHLKELNQNIL
jgi:hypothetical protein